MALTAMKLEKHKCNIVCLDGRVIHSDVTVSLFFMVRVLNTYVIDECYERFIYVLLIELVQHITGQCSYFIPPENTRKPLVFRGYKMGPLARTWLTKLITFLKVNSELSQGMKLFLFMFDFGKHLICSQTKIMYMYTGCIMVHHLSTFQVIE